MPPRSVLQTAAAGIVILPDVPAPKYKRKKNLMERNQNGYPIAGGGLAKRVSPRCGCMPEQMPRLEGGKPCPEKPDGGCNGDSLGIDSLPLAYAYVPMQKFRLLYNPERALKQGTLFEELDLPLGVYFNGK